jgi:hypothetical protein
VFDKLGFDKLPVLTAEYGFATAIFIAFKPPGIDSALFLGRSNYPLYKLKNDLEIVNVDSAIGQDGVSTVCSPWGVQSTTGMDVSSFTSDSFGS